HVDELALELEKQSNELNKEIKRFTIKQYCSKLEYRNRLLHKRGSYIMKNIITANHAGMSIRNEVKDLLEELNIEYEDAGCDGSCSVDYPDYALPAAKRVASGEFDRGIFICGTGIGMSISANKVKGIRCALVHDMFSAKA